MARQSPRAIATAATSLLLLASREVSAHGGLTIPRPRNNFQQANPAVRLHGNGATFHNNGAFCTGDECLWFNEGCWIGCPSNCSSKMPANNPKATGYKSSPKFTYNTYGEPNCEGWKPVEPTLPEKYRTWNIGNPSQMGDFTKYHPWRAPGYAPTSDPCGMGGAYMVEAEGGVIPAGQSRLFTRGSDLPASRHASWRAGDTVEVAWMVGSNHGGGYLYSLCPAGERLTEQCFHNITLPFVGSTHTIRYLDNGTEFTIPATDVNEGTWPVGSAWRLNPIPACNCDKGDGCKVGNESDLTRAYSDDGPPKPEGEATNGNECQTGTQFPVPFPYGYGMHTWYNNESGPSRNMWAIVDKVQLPNIVGDFVLRWRWDTEQNPQIWTHCADVRLNAN